MGVLTNTGISGAKTPSLEEMWLYIEKNLPSYNLVKQWKSMIRYEQVLELYLQLVVVEDLIIDLIQMISIKEIQENHKNHSTTFSSN